MKFVTIISVVLAAISVASALPATFPASKPMYMLRFPHIFPTQKGDR
jgi:hypothetical protein